MYCQFVVHSCMVMCVYVCILVGFIVFYAVMFANCVYVIILVCFIHKMCVILLYFNAYNVCMHTGLSTSQCWRCMLHTMYMQFCSHYFCNVAILFTLASYSGSSQCGRASSPVYVHRLDIDRLCIDLFHWHGSDIYVHRLDVDCICWLGNYVNSHAPLVWLCYSSQIETTTAQKHFTIWVQLLLVNNWDNYLICGHIKTYKAVNMLGYVSLIPKPLPDFSTAAR